MQLHAWGEWAAALTCSPPGDHDGEDARIDGEHGDEDVGGRGQGAHNVGPDAAAVQELHEEAQPALQQRAVLAREHDLKVTLHSTAKSRQTFSIPPLAVCLACPEYTCNATPGHSWRRRCLQTICLMMLSQQKPHGHARIVIALRALSDQLSVYLCCNVAELQCNLLPLSSENAAGSNS